MKQILLKQKTELIKIFEQNNVDISKPIVFTCGSGMTACVLGMAYSLISGKNAVIYDGSWSEYGKKMKRSKKVTIGIIIFFIIVATVIGGRTAMGLYFKKKFGKRPPPGVIVEIVSEKKFSKTIESYCTALSSKTTSFKIKKVNF